MTDRPAAPGAASGAAPGPGGAAKLLLRWLGGFGAAFSTVLGVGSLVFLAFRVLPGDPTSLVLGEQATDLERAALRARLHLDESLLRQWGRFLSELAHGRFGASLRRPDVDALRAVGEVLPATAALAATAVMLGALFGIGVALAAVAPRASLPRALARRALSLSASVPLLAFAPAATWVFSVRLRLVPLPADPEAGVSGLVFAAVLLAIPLGAAVGRVTRTALSEAGRSPFLSVARAKGLGEPSVWVLHALPTCAGPIVTVVAAQLGALLGGAVVLERLLERRGLGTVLAEALLARDLPVIQAAVVVSAALFVAVQALSVQVHAWVDPRAR